MQKAALLDLNGLTTIKYQEVYWAIRDNVFDDFVNHTSTYCKGKLEVNNQEPTCSNFTMGVGWKLLNGDPCDDATCLEK